MADYKPVIFKVGDEEYGVDITMVRGIENVQSVVRVPNVGRHIKGIINLRGDVIPVFSLRSKFNFPEVDTTESTKHIIVQTDKFLLALEVDKVDEIQNVSEDMIHPVSVIIKSKETSYIKNVINKDNKLVIIIDVDNILTEEEKAEIEEMLENQE